MPAPINDPALLEEIGRAADEEELAVIVRLPDPEAVPRGVRVITRFADIATVRISRTRLLELAESVTAIEAPRNLRPSLEVADDPNEPEETDEGDGDDEPAGGPDDNGPPRYTRRPEGVGSGGRGTVVAALDWGLDVAHPAFRRADGSTRVLALWDQRGDEPPGPGNRWGYGRIFSAADIDRALETDDPYRALGYDPADAAGKGGAHGTHVLDIAAGSGEGGGMPGVAPEADLVFVHLARTTEVLSPGNLGDSASVLEALDFVFSVAGDRPCSANMSVGAHGGPHDGGTLVELGIDRAVALVPGRAVVNSAGNYQSKRAHATGRVPPGSVREVRIEVPTNDPSQSEVEIFYGHIDRFVIEVLGPAGNLLARVEPGENFPLVDSGRMVGRIRHVIRHGTSGDHHVDILIDPDPPGGVWVLRLIGEKVNDGRYHAWIERDRGLQPKFVLGDVSRSSTTGTLCNGRLSITCGCIDPHREPLMLARFSSGGPTRDGRIKPELVAPGYRIRAARSTPRGQAPGARYTIKSGTSMAAPHVAGTIALMFEAAGRPLEIHDTRALLFGSVDPTPFFNRPRLEPDLHRFGYGVLDIPAAERAARSFGGERGGEPEGSPALEEIAMGAIQESEQVEADVVETEQTPEGYGDAEETPDAGGFEVVEQTAETAEPEWRGGGADDIGTTLAENAPETESESDATDAFESGEEEPEPVPPAQRITEALGALSWISDVAQLGKLAFEALGTAEEETLELVSGDPSRVGPGDLLIRPAPVDGGQYVGVIVSERPLPWQALANRGVSVESANAGGFVEVLEIPPGGGPPQRVGRQLTTESGTLAPRQQVLHAGPWQDPETEDQLAETIDVDDVAVEMNGLNCTFLQQYTATTPAGGTRRFSSGAIQTIDDWNGTSDEATIDTARVPKLILDPKPAVVRGMRPYNVNLAGQRRAVLRVRRDLADHLAQRPSGGSDTWNREKARLEALVTRKATIYNRMWIRQMMYNRFDVPIAFWTRHYNRTLSPTTDLDPDVVKSMAYQESRMGTSGAHLMPPPYDYNSGTRHPVRSRFNILQAVDSFGQQQWLMMKEMAPTIWSRHGLDQLEPGARWLGMSGSDYMAHPTFPAALKEFFEARSGGGNLMGTRNVDLHLDYDFWIRTGIRWLFAKYQRLRTRSWPEAVRAYNGGGSRAQAYKRAVLARVGPDDPFAAESGFVDAEEPELAEDERSSAAELSWLDITRVTGSGGSKNLYYVVTGAARSKAAAGDEGKAIFKLKVHNSNAKYNFQNVVVKWRLVKFDSSRVATVIVPWQKFQSRDLEDESSRIIKFHLERNTLRTAYDPDNPLARFEVEYHWREKFFTSGTPYYNATGIDFFLMAPIEFLLGKRKRLGPDVPLNDKAKHQDQFWIPLSGVEFTPELKENVTFTLEVTTQLREEANASQATAKKTTTTTTQSRSTADTFSASLTGEISKGSTLKASVDIFELGLSEMFKLGGTLGYSTTTTNTTSTAVAKEFAQSITLSKTYSKTLGTTLRTTVTISRPEVAVPRGTGKKEPKPVKGYGGVGIYMYPTVAFFEVPYIRFGGVNGLGQATSRSAGKVIVPFVTGWRVTTRKD